LRNVAGLFSLVTLVVLGVMVSFPFMLVSPDGLGKRVSNACYRLWARCSLRLFGVRVFLMGAQNLAGAPCVLVANHRSHLDVPVLGCLVNMPLCAVYKRSLARIPFLGFALWMSRSVGIDREDAKDCREQMTGVAGRLKSGRTILVFPEGSRSTGVGLAAFKKGAVATAIQQGVEILPVTIVGTDALYPPGQLMVERGNVLVVVHPRLSSRGLNWQDRGVLNQRMQEVVASAFGCGEPSPLRLSQALRVL